MQIQTNSSLVLEERLTRCRTVIPAFEYITALRRYLAVYSKADCDAQPRSAKLLARKQIEMAQRTVHQPLHPSILDSIDPEYRAYHEDFIQYLPKSEDLPFSPSMRSAPAAPGNSHTVPVGEEKELNFSNCRALCWIPEGVAPLGLSSTSKHSKSWA